MHQKTQHQGSHPNTTECCFVQFFSQNSSQDPNIKKNPSGLISPYNDHKPTLYQNQLVFAPKKVKPQFNGSKRSISSISSMKANRRGTNRGSYQTEENRQVIKDQPMMQKLKNPPLRGSEAVHRYFSPKPQLNTTLSKSQLEDKRKIDEYINTRNVQNRIQYVSGKPHTFFKKEKVNQPIQFAKSLRQPNPEPTQTISPKIDSNFNFVKADTIQNLHQNGPYHYSSVQPSINIFRHQRTQQTSFVEHSFQTLNSQRYEKPKGDQNMRHLHKKQNPVQVSVNNSIHLKLSEYRNRKQSAQIKSVALQNICEMSKQQSRHQAYIQVPINPFHHIESFIMEVKKEKGERDQDEKQYDSIRTKGRPVQSMLQMTKDLTKTKKDKKQGNKRQSTGLHDMDNMTVTSEFDEDSQDDGRQRIEESAVLLNFFNPPTHYKDRMDLSRAKKQVFQERSGFY